MDHPHHSQKEAAFAEKIGYTLTHHSMSLVHDKIFEVIRATSQPNVSPDLVIYHAFPAAMRAIGQTAAAMILAQMIASEVAYKEEPDREEILTKLREQYMAKFHTAFDEAVKKSLPKIEAIKTLIGPTKVTEPKHGV